MLVLLYPFPLGITVSRYRLFIYLGHLFNNFAYTSQLLILCLYTSYGFFLSIPVITFLFIPVINQLFIQHTSAPVEMSVWLGGRALMSAYDAFCVQDAVQVV